VREDADKRKPLKRRRNRIAVETAVAELQRRGVSEKRIQKLIKQSGWALPIK
jgi:DNA-binding transcriptional regulator YhcF (GntR family)